MSNIVCSPNAVVAFNYFIGRGLRDYQAAAIVGNLQQESGLNPRLSAPDPRPTNPAAMGRGIAMWGDPGRWQNLIAFAASTSRDPWALDTQLDFVWEELPNAGLDSLLAAPTLEEAVLVFQDQFERPRKSSAHTDVRISYARAAMLSCPHVNLPPKPRSSTVKNIAAAIAGGALAALVGFGIYKAQSTRRPEPEPPPPRPPPPRPRPPFTPVPPRPARPPFKPFRPMP